MHLLEHSNIPIEGRNVVVVGGIQLSSGKPMALMLMARDATVAICHAKTRDPGAVDHPSGHPGRRSRCPQAESLPQMVKTRRGW